MTREEQSNHCEVCEFHRIIECGNTFRIMSCHHGNYHNHPVWGDFKCPLGDDKPTKKEEMNDIF